MSTFGVFVGVSPPWARFFLPSHSHFTISGIGSFLEGTPRVPASTLYAHSSEQWLALRGLVRRAGTEPTEMRTELRTW